MSSSVQPSGRSGGMVERRFVGDPVFAFQREMNRLLDDVFRGFAVPGIAGPGGAGLGNLMMPQIDVSETENELRIAVEMPGVAPDEIEIRLDDDVLTIRGEKRVERRDDRENVHFTERAYGTFQRVLRLPFSPDPNQVQARFENGVLIVALPKPKGQEISHRINVQSAQQGGNGGGGRRQDGGSAQGGTQSGAPQSGAASSGGR
ncbi:MAG TPA: Hsp20/alpha crystallin family protein [Crenalkalicoccus sp.]|nr:Hsp20/alpha crystallin family protein [Crenalkalicoccus sp.]